MASNLEYIYILRDRYSKKLASITKKQLAFTQAYRKSMGKVNAASAHHGRIIAHNTKVYNANKQAMARVNSHLNTLTQSQSRYTKASNRRLTKLNQEWRKHGKVVRAQQTKQKGKGARLAGMAAGVGAGFVVKNIFDTATKFEGSMNRIKALSVGRGVDMDIMRKKAMQWGITTQFSALQVAGAMAESTQAGNDMNKTLAIMPGNIALAAVGQMTLVDAMKLSTDVVKQFTGTVSDMKIADVLATGSKTAEANVTELGAALRNTGLQAHQAGLTIEETMMGIMALGAVGQRGEAGGTYFMNFMVQLQKMTATSPKVKAFKALLAGTGKSFADIYDVKTGQFKDFTSFLDVISKADRAKVQAFSGAFDIRAMKGIKALSALSPENLEKYKKAMGNVAGSSLAMQKILMDGLPGGVKLFDSALETSKLVMINDFVKPLSIVMRQLATFLVYLSQNHAWVLKLTFGLMVFMAAMTALGVAALVITGTFMNMILVGWALVKVVGFLKLAWLTLNLAFTLTPIGLIITGIAALIALFALAWTKTGSFTNALKFMGGMIMKFLLQPINLVILGIRGLLFVASKIPGVVGKGFGVAYNKTTAFQDQMNLMLTGNKSATVLGMGYDMITQGDKSSTWMDSKTKEVANQRTEYITRPIEVGGDIKVSAEPGSKVTKESFNFNSGINMVPAGGMF